MEEREALLMGELVRVWVRQGGGAAVVARERTGSGHLPVDIQGGSSSSPGEHVSPQQSTSYVPVPLP